jgi:hypothetical protein
MASFNEIREKVLNLLPDSKDVGASEYSAIRETLLDGLLDDGVTDPKAHAIAMLDEFATWGLALKAILEDRPGSFRHALKIRTYDDDKNAHTDETADLIVDAHAPIPEKSPEWLRIIFGDELLGCSEVLIERRQNKWWLGIAQAPASDCTFGVHIPDDSTKPIRVVDEQGCQGDSNYGGE